MAQKVVALYGYAVCTTKNVFSAVIGDSIS